MFPVFLLVLLLSSASAQTYSEGACNPDIETKKDLDINKFQGTWYAGRRGYNFYEDRTSCYIVKFSTSADAALDMLSTFVIENVGSQTIHYKLTATENELKTGRFTVTPALISESMPYWVLDTDYENYTIQYTCMNAYKGKIEYLWINTRSQNPTSAILDKAVGIARSRNINIPIIDSSQKC